MEAVGAEDDAGAVSDLLLARRAALHDRAAFTTLVDRHGPALYRYVLRMVQDPEVAADCLQDTLVAAWTGFAGFRGESAPRTWLFGIATRQAYRHRSRAAHVPGPLPDELVETASHPPDQDAVDAALVEALDIALLGLPPLQRSCWLLREVEGLHYAEIADILGTTHDAVRGMLHRARATLAETMKGWR
ncbi:RNA polymerase sigma factor [Oerskovia jenensis]|uniref:RNA polymerase sigma-70 factor (ECF subfamily) n=1 Tax=Oerskovia jenensis TaxID=162169 RepID=A0ABS2LKQ3_9CELL|nr:RNA polymerase sigma factor [Oerskovia jenensis]MBM7481003.1 RNA polymerase sigma-70 factor (ECF subfamily) [Oerskovia jenensis]